METHFGQDIADGITVSGEQNTIHGKRYNHVGRIIDNLSIVGKDGLIGGVSAWIHVIDDLRNGTRCEAKFSDF